MVFLFVAGPTLYILSTMPGNLGYYLQHLIGTSFRIFTPQGNPEAAAWQSEWTLFYWGWWISWAPFVGMFIARISYGRTIRQFILGTLLAPVGASIVWFTVFGGSGLFYERFRSDAIGETGTANALFVLLEQLPVPAILTTLASVLGLLVVTLFFATSSDSGSLVVDMLTNGGDPRPNRYQRLFWAVLEGLIAIVLLLAGGIGALQTASITTGLPFAVVLLLLCAGLLGGLRQESVVPTPVPPATGGRQSSRDQRNQSAEEETSDEPPALGEQDYSPE